MPSLHVMIGVPASGKSTLAEQLRTSEAPPDQCVVVSSDALRVVLTGDPDAPLDKDAEMWPLYHKSVEAALANGYSVVADATNLTEASRAPYFQHSSKVRVVAHLMCVPYMAAAMRNGLRSRCVPTHVMIEMQSRMDAITVQDLYDEGFDEVILHTLTDEPLRV